MTEKKLPEVGDEVKGAIKRISKDLAILDIDGITGLLHTRKAKGIELIEGAIVEAKVVEVKDGRRKGEKVLELAHSDWKIRTDFENKPFASLQAMVNDAGIRLAHRPKSRKAA